VSLFTETKIALETSLPLERKIRIIAIHETFDFSK